MGAHVLVDSSWYIRLARARRDPLHELSAIARVRKLATCGVVRCEVGRGIRSAEILARYQLAWDRMVDVATDRDLWRDVERTLWQLDRAGHPLPLPDVVIACCARRIGAVVLTFGDHFHAIPGITALTAIA